MSVLFYLPKAVRIQSDGRPYASAQAFFYQTGTLNDKDVFTDSALAVPFAQPVQADSEGQFPPIYLDETQTYKLILKTASGVQIDNIDPFFLPLISTASLAPFITQDILGQIIWPRTAAEISAGVTPSDYAKLPGDLRRYGGISDNSTNSTSAWVAAIAQSQQTDADRASVYIPFGTGCKIDTGATASDLPFSVIGGLMLGCGLVCSTDITALTVNYGASGSEFGGFYIQGPGTSTSTKPGIIFNNSNGNTARRINVSAFDIGIQFQTGINSSYSNSLYDCEIISNKTINIEGQLNTNALFLSNCTIGGGPCATGLKLVDSNNLTVSGGDAEGLTLTVFDLDASSTLNAAHCITGFHFEGNTSSAGDIRIGNTAEVNGVTLVGNLYDPGAANDSAINALKGTGLTVIGGELQAGYSGVTFRRIDAAFGSYVIEGVGQWPNERSYHAVTGPVVTTRATLTYSTSMTPNAALSSFFEIVISDGVAFAVNAPGNPTDGQILRLQFLNGAGAPHGTGTFDAAYHLSGGGTTLPAIADTKNRTLEFVYRGGSSAWYQVGAMPTDVAN